MSQTYVKLFQSLPESTLWCEPYHVRIVWITMLASCNREGHVFASVPGLAKRANVTVEEAIDALGRFQSPDKFSRTPDQEGRRIEPIDGGWRLVNYVKYREEAASLGRKAAKLKWWHDNKGRNAPGRAAAHSQDAAAGAIEESKRAATSAAPMPDSIRGMLPRT